MRTRLLLLSIGALVSAACFGGGSNGDEPAAPAAPSAIATATPYPATPQPTIVAAASSTSSEQVTYIVQPEDTLSEIAERFATTVEALMTLNKLTDATLIVVGQELLLPADDEPTAGTNADDGPDGTDDASIYVVEAGDTAWAIANAHDTTIEELAAANDLTVDELASLQPGDRLNLPRPR